MTRFILNDELVETNLPKGMVLADFIRYKQSLTGTKLGCREGDCGACTILVGSLDDNGLNYESVTSCLMPLGNAKDKHIVSVEGLNIKGLNVPQKAITDHGGTQCGFCTPGFVVSLCGFALSDKAKNQEQGTLSIAGNICRCTGYKSIERAIGTIVDSLVDKDDVRPIEWLVSKKFLPDYFNTIKERLDEFKNESQKTNILNTESVFVGGGTDLYVQRPEEMFDKQIIHTLHHSDLKGIWKDKGRCHIGASVTTEELKQSTVIKELCPQTDQFFNLISSLQIRNMATIAGNLVNASPIGDLAIFFLALNSNIVLNDNGALREIPLNQFFQGYKTLDKKENEFVQEINYLLPTSSYLFNFEKVSKRTYLDIASVNSAICLHFDEQCKISMAHISAGGLAPVPKYLLETSKFLIGKLPNKSILDKSIEIAQSEVAPIGDVRGSVRYKRLLFRQLLTAHYMKFFPELYNC
ncbi:MAG: FAD binding domain-containing protein [Saprospiraceae bacterium]|nr:FAD binding domain-containing protein [Saprospiraceae bacterium]